MELTAEVLIPLALVASLLYVLVLQSVKRTKTAAAPSKPAVPAVVDPELEIEPLNPDLALEDIEPLQLRPYKPVYYVYLNQTEPITLLAAMGIKSCSHSDMFPLDKTYPWKVALREQLVAERPEHTIKSLPSSRASVTEMYEWTLGVYLPRKMPRHFVRVEEEQVMWNRVTDRKWPLKAPEDIDECLRILAVNVETDLLMMEEITDQDSPHCGKYMLTAICACFPNGLNFVDLIGEPLAKIHAPVPLYKEKLQMSMDRFFTKLEPGKVVQRHNWTITAHQTLHAPKGLKLRQEDDAREAYSSHDAKAQIEKEAAPECALRVERQTLHRFPKSKAILFGVHTYLYPLKDIKAEGQGEALATAVEGLFPAMGFFKSRPLWGEAVKSYLRS